MYGMVEDLYLPTSEPTKQQTKTSVIDRTGSRMHHPWFVFERCEITISKMSTIKSVCGLGTGDGPKVRTGFEKEEVRRFRFEPPDLADLDLKALVPDLGTKILVPKKMESPRGGASRYAGGYGSPPVKTI